jgi:hypothetical protein
VAAIAEAIARVRAWTGKESDMGDLAGIAQRLRAVKLAQRRFLRLWDIERAFIDPLIERVAAELDGSTGDADTETLAGTTTAVTDKASPRPALDRGRRLDDEG